MGTLVSSAVERSYNRTMSFLSLLLINVGAPSREIVDDGIFLIHFPRGKLPANLG